MDKAGRVREVSQRDRSENLQSQRQVPLNPYREAVPGDESVRRQLAADARGFFRTVRHRSFAMRAPSAS